MFGNSRIVTYRFSLSSHHLNPRHRRFVVFSLMVKSGFELGAPRWHSTVLSTLPLEPPTPLTKRCVSSLVPLLILKTHFNFDLNSWPIFKFGPMFVCFVFWVIRTDSHTPKNNNLSIKIEEKNFAYSTRCSQAVTHPSTNRAQRCLTSVIGRELVCSTWYGRRYWIELTSRHMLNLKCRLKLSSPARFRTLHPLYTPVFLTHFYILLHANDASIQEYLLTETPKKTKRALLCIIV